MQGLLKLHLDKILFRKLDTDMQRYLAFSKRQSDTRISKGDNVPIKDVFFPSSTQRILRRVSSIAIDSIVPH